jgi:hypothetical protein
VLQLKTILKLQTLTPTEDESSQEPTTTVYSHISGLEC